MRTTEIPAVPKPHSCDPQKFRRAASRLPTGVAIVTCADDEDRLHGMTANSFVSVTLHPPTALVSIKTGRMNELIRARGRYAVNVLGIDGQAISKHFSGSRDVSVQPLFKLRWGMPVLDAAIASVICDVTDAIRVFDHTLFLGTVIECAHTDESPLIFFGSQYCAPVLLAGVDAALGGRANQTGARSNGKGN